MQGALLFYEEAMTRSIQGVWYDTSTHMVWLDQASYDLEGSQVEFLRGINNPVGVKVGFMLGLQGCVY